MKIRVVIHQPEITAIIIAANIIRDGLATPYLGFSTTRGDDDIWDIHILDFVRGLATFYYLRQDGVCTTRAMVWVKHRLWHKLHEENWRDDGSGDLVCSKVYPNEIEEPEED